MLGLGWTEMLVIGVIALIVIGPKDLPVVMNRVGKIAGQIRRMGSEFQREINKSTGLDEVRNLRSSITAPLKKTSDEIRKEFNAMTPSGPKPSGLIKPADPAAESVVDEIRAQAGMTAPKTADHVAAEAGFKPAGPPPSAPTAAPAAPAKATPSRKGPVKAARPRRQAPLEAVPEQAETKAVASSVRKPTKPKSAQKSMEEVLTTEPADSPATSTPRARKPRKSATAKPASKVDHG
ncbi:MAG TPA: Sec-independent protein translocase protein TatB [Devosia sp.]|jgi:sec-independent protein translocase protein TatB|nr:Sec-independent protein translocase protein TatB [Devosia sp.]